MSSSDEAPTTRKGVKKPLKKTDDSSDDEAPVARTKKTVKKPVADSSDDEAPTTRKGAKKAADSDDDEPAPTAKKTIGRKGAKKQAADSDDDVAPTTTAAKHADPSVTAMGSAATSTAAAQQAADPGIIPFVVADYDAMTYDQFLVHLKSKSKAQRQEEYRLHIESVATVESEKGEDNMQKFTDGTGGYKYLDLLSRVMGQMPRQDGAHSSVRITAPKIEKLGSKRTVIVNFDRMCKDLSRDMEEVKDFIEKQLTTQSSIDSNNCLIVRIQNVKVSQIENIFQKYIEQYVQCSSCHSISTELKKDAATRLTTMTCKQCKATRTVTAVAQATFQAQTAKRARIRLKQL